MSDPIIPKVYPENDFVLIVTPKLVDGTGKFTPLTSAAAPTCFFATSGAPTAVAADATLVGTVTLATGSPVGRWIVKVQKSVMDYTLLNSLFAATAPWMIIEFAEGIRGAVECEYDAINNLVVG